MCVGTSSVWSAGWQPRSVGVSALRLSCLHLVVVASVTFPRLLCVFVCVLHSRSPPGFVKPDMPSSSESSRARTGSPLGLMLCRLTFEPQSPVWPKRAGQAARSAFCWVITGYQRLSVYLPMRRDSPRSANITGLDTNRRKQAFMCLQTYTHSLTRKTHTTHS